MNVAFIPVRGGSKSIPLKNIKSICGRPLVYWTIKAACGCNYIDKVFVATDSDIIRKTVEEFKSGTKAKEFFKMEVISRSEESASDTASTEFAMLEFANKYEFDNIVLIQATSPLLTSDDLNRGFETFDEPGTDSVLSVVPQKRFLWNHNDNGFVISANYDIFHRPRRQEFGGYLVENGAFYITSKKNFMQSKNRISGNIKAVEMSEDTFFEIDEPSDWLIIEALMKKKRYSPLIEKPEIRMFLTDCDGCLTDGGMYYSEYGDELKKFNTRDGMGFDLLKKRGIITGIITGEDVSLNRKRADKLKIDELIQGCKDKVNAVRFLCEKYQIEMANVAYIGDDINDIDVIKVVGLSFAPANAMPQVKKVAEYITEAKGGEGAIREVAEFIIRYTKA